MSEFDAGRWGGVAWRSMTSVSLGAPPNTTSRPERDNRSLLTSGARNNIRPRTAECDGPHLRSAQPDPDRRRRYVPVAVKFWLAQAFALSWVGGSVWLSLPWLHQLGRIATPAGAIAVICCIAYLPGWLVAFLAASLVIDRQPPLRVVDPGDAVTVVIAARNEAERIAETIACIARQEYSGPLEVLVVDNGSTDGTGSVALAAGGTYGVDVRCIREERPGKSHALNRSLELVRTNLVVTLDADTLLHPLAIRHLVRRMASSPSDVQAVAGSVLVRNSRESFWTRMQEWDYFLGIASVKRMQGLYQGTLVAQGAFSLYRTDALRGAGGWPDAIGEDIVLTWQLLRQGARVYYEPTAVAFTAAPARLRPLVRQRARWARGMIEGLRVVHPWEQPRWMARCLTGIDLMIPLLDVAYTGAWLPGLVLACTGRFWLVGPFTIAVLPLTLLVNAILFRFQHRHVFDELGLTVRRNLAGFVAFVGIYQILMSPVAVLGYCQELVGARRRWK
jgi:poly-beta-1,6-N-acetyl-D-glucosamine synthase